MKTAVFTVLVAALVTQVSLAQQGENDGPNSNDDGRMIACVNQVSGATILQFISTQGAAQVSTAEFDLAVKARGDEVGEMALLDKRTNDLVVAKRLEELLKVTLTAAGSAPLIVESLTRRGYAESIVVHPTSGDRASVKSQSRKGESRMEVILTTAENATSATSIVCQKLR